jgi:Zn-dependent peptidase ImmA (M78 family)
MTGLSEARARQLLREYCIENPTQLGNLEEIANAEGLIVEDASLDYCEASIIYEESYGLVKISKNIREPGARRFALAHEMGHFYNDKLRLHRCSSEDLLTLKSKKMLEDNANAFAVELLMKKDWFVDFVKGCNPGIEAIRDAAKYFGVSMTAAAIRYAGVDVFPVAVISSKHGKVLWSAISKSFRFQYIQRGQPVNEYSAAYDFFIGKDVSPEPQEILADAWFQNDKDFANGIFMMEQTLVLKNYDALLTLVWEKPLDVR